MLSHVRIHAVQKNHQEKHTCPSQAGASPLEAPGSPSTNKAEKIAAQGSPRPEDLVARMAHLLAGTQEQDDASVALAKRKMAAATVVGMGSQRVLARHPALDLHIRHRDLRRLSNPAYDTFIYGEGNA
ncbi:hypothetical protein D3C76_1175800 [compost metagenome]